MQKRLPELEARLLDMIAAWEEEEQQPLTLDGVRYAEEVEADMDGDVEKENAARREREERIKQKREKGATLPLPGAGAKDAGTATPRRSVAKSPGAPLLAASQSLHALPSTPLTARAVGSVVTHTPSRPSSAAITTPARPAATATPARPVATATPARPAASAASATPRQPPASAPRVQAPRAPSPPAETKIQGERKPSRGAGWKWWWEFKQARYNEEIQ